MYGVAVLYKAASHRSKELAHALHAGIARCGERVTLHDKAEGLPNVSTIVAYGWIPFRNLFEQQLRRGGHYVFVDLGFWGRKTGIGTNLRIDYLGHHKLSVDGRHPTKTWPLNCAHDRFKASGLQIKPWRPGEHILVAGMSAKAAQSHGFAPQQWERRTIEKLRKITTRRILYRSKPGDALGGPMDGVDYCSPDEPLSRALQGAHALVARHSNAVIEALLEGVQIYCEDNIGKFMSMPSLDMIDGCFFPKGREQFMADTAYCQWTVDEMRSGTAWAFIRESGLLDA